MANSTFQISVQNHGQLFNLWKNRLGYYEIRNFNSSAILLSADTEELAMWSIRNYMTFDLCGVRVTNALKRHYEKDISSL